MANRPSIECIPGVWRGFYGPECRPDHRSNPHSSRDVCSDTGWEALNRLLGGGWPRAALSEMLLESAGCGELQLLLPTLRQWLLERHWLLLLDPPATLYGPALQAQELPLERIRVVHTRTFRDWLWASEQVLRASGSAALLAWCPRTQPHYTHLRRLQLAAVEGGCPGFLLRPQQALDNPSPAALRLQLDVNRHGLRLQVIKCRGMAAGGVLQWHRPPAWERQPAISEWLPPASCRGAGNGDRDTRINRPPLSPPLLYQ